MEVDFFCTPTRRTQGKMVRAETFASYQLIWTSTVRLTKMLHTPIESWNIPPCLLFYTIFTNRTFWIRNRDFSQPITNAQTRKRDKVGDFLQIVEWSLGQQICLNLLLPPSLISWGITLLNLRKKWSIFSLKPSERMWKVLSIEPDDVRAVNFRPAFVSTSFRPLAYVFRYDEENSY